MQEAARSSHYGDPQSVEFRAALAERHGGGPENYLVGAGIDGLFISLARAYLRPGMCVSTTRGSYPTFEYAVKGTGAELVYAEYSRLLLPMPQEGQDWRFPRPDPIALAALGADVLYLANPDNPSGALTPAQEVQSLLRDDRLLVLDEAYADFVPEDQLLPIDLRDRRIVRFRTFSKAHGMAGQRIGYVMGHPDVLEPLSRVRPHFEVSIVAQAGALASLRDKNYTAEVIEHYNAGRIELSQILQEAGLTPLPSSTNFVTAQVGTREEAEALLNRLLQRGVFIRKPALPPLDGCIRVTIGRPEDHAILAEALRPD